MKKKLGMKKRKIYNKIFGFALLCLIVGSSFGGIVLADPKFNIGDTVEVTANLNVRTGPGTSYPEITDPDYIGYAPVGTMGTVLDGPSSSDGYVWWKVDYGPGLYSGWSVEDWLEKVSTQPDLTVTSVNAPSSAEPGDYIAVSWTVKNQGDGSSGSFYNRISLAMTPYGTDISLGNFIMSSIGAGSSSSDAEVPLIPETVSPGYYYVTVFADAFYDVTESNENNNINKAPNQIHITSNQPPTLSSGYVTPSSGDTSTTFNYYVTYKDTDGDAPTTKYVYIDGAEFTMTKESGSYSSGATFKYSTTLSTGSHNYYFHFNDGHDHTVRLPPSGTYSGPSVTQPDTTPPTVDAFSVTPDSVTLGNSFTISYTVSDTGGSGLKQVELWRKNTGDWGQIEVTSLAGVGNGPYSGSFSDAPTSVGTYWYGIHVVDNAENWNDEKNSHTGGLPGVFGPIEVEVVPENDWKSPSSTGKSYNDWEDPENAYSSNNQYAEASTWYAAQDWYNFGLDIPSGSAIDGIEIKLEGKGDGDDYVGKVKCRVFFGSIAFNETNYLEFPATEEAVHTVGSPSDLWGYSYWKPEHFEDDADIPFVVRLTTGADWHTCRLDHIQVKVHYTEVTTQPPSPPRNLRVTDVGDGYVKLAWDPPLNDGGSPISTYKIYRGTSSGSETPYSTVSSDWTTFNNDANIVNGVTYYYKVTAVNGIGESDFSNEVSATANIQPSSQVYGIDVSHYQNEKGNIDWSEVYNSGYRFAFVKATEGDDRPPQIIDEYFETNMNEGHNAGILMGAYHYAYPQYNDAVAEAQFFVDIAGDYIKGGYLRPALDLEEGTESTMEALSNWVHEWMNTVESETGVQPILYTYSDYANNYLDSSVTQYDLWIAHWTYNPDTYPNTGLWNSWDFWQYSDEGSVTGINGNVLMDIFNGDMSKLQDNFVIEQTLSANIKVDKTSAVSGERVVFDGSDSKGQIVSYKWNFGDGTIVAGSGKPTVEEHRFRGAMNDPKEYTVKLTVLDNSGDKVNETCKITITSLKKTVEVTQEHVFVRITASYNWIDEINGENNYIISKIQCFNYGLLGGYRISILDSTSKIKWSDYLFAMGVSTKTYVSPFTSTPALGTPCPVSMITFLEGTLEGIKVGAFDAIHVSAAGYYVGLIHGITPPMPSPFFGKDSTYFNPDSIETPDFSIEPPDLDFANLCSPGELRVYDSQGQITGSVNGKAKEEIPYSVYSNNTILILFPSGSYYYEVAGTEDGTYGLILASIREGENDTVVAADIPIWINAIHRYTIEWNNSQGEAKVTKKIDVEGDGTFEQTKTMQLPTASIDYSSQDLMDTKKITFDASGSYDPDGKVVSYEWNFGDGKSSSGMVVTNTYSTPGKYMVTLMIIDNDGLTSTYFMEIEVKERGIPGFELLFFVIAVVIVLLWIRKQD